MSGLIVESLVSLDADLGASKDEVIEALAAQVAAAGRTGSVATLVADLQAREGAGATGLPGGIAIPHCRTAAVAEPTLAFARLPQPVDFGAKDGGADLVFLIAAPDGADNTHLSVLAKLARALAKSDFAAELRAAQLPAMVVSLVEGVVAGTASAPRAASAPSGDAAPEAAVRRRLVGVTACPTGIAHTYMAAEALEAAAERAGVDIAVETQGSAGATPLDPSVIASAEAVIFSVDVGVRDRGRFAGKPVVQSGVKRPIDDGDALIAEALRAADDPRAARVEASDGDKAAAGQGGASAESWGGRVRRILMTGVSYMIPFVAAGGLLIALSFLLAGYDMVYAYGQIAVHSTFTHLPDLAQLRASCNAAGTPCLHHVLFDSPLMAYVGTLLFILGKTAFMFFVPALAGYIAYAIADRPGIAPGFIVGGLASNIFGVTDGATNATSLPATGFLGAIVGGVLAGLVAHWIAGWRVPSWARGLMPVMLIPLLTTLIAGLVMLVLLGRPIGWLMTHLTDGLNSLNGSSAVLLGIILGLMMAFDMGGPLNKVAYSFAVAGIGGAALASNAPQLKVMAAVMLAGMVPPMGLALATVVRPGLFTAAEHENGKAAWLLGASFITEGAIPFAAADPLRVIPSIMLGSAVTGGVSELLGVAVRAPHGGIFVLFAVHNIAGYFIALVAGVVVSAAAVVVLKSLARRPVVAPVN